MEDASRIRVSVYVPGLLPSSRELSQLLEVIEVAIVWGTLSEVLRQNEAFDWDTDERKQLAPIVARMEESYRLFLSKRYRSLLMEGIIGSIPNAAELAYQLNRTRREQEPRLREVDHSTVMLTLPADVDDGVRKALSGREFHGDSFAFMDFSGWVTHEFGSDILTTVAVDPTGSIEFAFDLLNIVTLLTLQQSPALMDSLSYGLLVIKEWMGKGSNRVPGTSPPPQLDAGLLRLLGKYDDIELRITPGPIGPEYQMRLIRGDDRTERAKQRPKKMKAAAGRGKVSQSRPRKR